MPKEPTIRERVDSLELAVDLLVARAENAETAEMTPEQAALRQKLDEATTALAAMNADRIARHLEKELQKDQISTLRVRNLAIAYNYARNAS